MSYYPVTDDQINAMYQQAQASAAATGGGNGKIWWRPKEPGRYYVRFLPPYATDAPIAEKKSTHKIWKPSFDEAACLKPFGVPCPVCAFLDSLPASHPMKANTRDFPKAKETFMMNVLVVNQDCATFADNVAVYIFDMASTIFEQVSEIAKNAATRGDIFHQDLGRICEIIKPPNFEGKAGYAVAVLVKSLAIPDGLTLHNLRSHIHLNTPDTHANALRFKGVLETLASGRPASPIPNDTPITPEGGLGSIPVYGQRTAPPPPPTASYPQSNGFYNQQTYTGAPPLPANPLGYPAAALTQPPPVVPPPVQQPQQPMTPQSVPPLPAITQQFNYPGGPGGTPQLQPAPPQQGPTNTPPQQFVPPQGEVPKPDCFGRPDLKNPQFCAMCPHRNECHSKAAAEAPF